MIHPKVIKRELNDVTEVASGQGAPQGKHYFGKSGHYFVRAGSLEHLVAGKNYNLLERINSEVATAHKLRLFPAGTVLFAKSGMSVTKDRVLMLEHPSYVTNHLAALVPSDNLDPRYLMFWLRNFRPSRLIQDKSYPSIRLSDIASIKIPLSPLPVQKKIAAILEKADHARRKRQEALRLTDQFLQSAFLEMFGDMKYPSLPLERFSANRRGAFVNGPFGSNLLTRELVPEGVPVIYIRDIRDGEYKRISKAYVTQEKAEELAVCKVKGEDVLIAKVGNPPGIAAVYPENQPPAIVTQDVIRISINRELVTSEYLRSFLNSSVGQTTIQPIIVEGTRARFSLSSFKKISVPVPPLDLQKRFSRIAKRAEHFREKQRQSEQELETLFQSLMQEAFRTSMIIND